MISIAPITFEGAPVAWPPLETVTSDRGSLAGDTIEIPLRNIELKVSISLISGRLGPMRIDADRGDENVVHLRANEDEIRQVRAYLGADRGAGSQPCRIEADDPVVRHLSAALENAESKTCEFNAVYADAMRLAIVTRVLHLQAKSNDASGQRRHVPLPKWRLKRLIDYVDENYGGNVTLASMAAAAGLSRMHFAAQFRAATGMRPHQYVMKRRIDAAKQMLRETDAALVDVALDSGFQSQAHFTTVFKRFTGATPHRWRSEFENPSSNFGRQTSNEQRRATHAEARIGR